MGILIGNKKKAKVPEGTYLSKMIDIDYKEGVMTKSGLQDRINITHVTREGYKLIQSYNATTSENSHFGKLARSLFGEINEEEFDIDFLRDVECEIVVKHHTTEDGNVYANIVEVKPISRLRMEQAQLQEERTQKDMEKWFEGVDES